MSFMGPLLGLETVLTQTAEILRDQATKDEFGATSSRDWQLLSTVSCFLWWGTGRILTRAGSIHEHPEARADLDTGGMLIPTGTDVTAHDRIGQVLDADGTLIASGLQVIAVLPYEGVAELSFRKAD